MYDSGPKILHELKVIAISEGLGPDLPAVCKDIDCVGLGDGACSRPIHIRLHVDSSTARRRLWLLYVGTLIERAPHSRLMMLGTSFQTAFVSGAIAMGYPSWQAVRDSLLKDFLYEDDMVPEADLWFANAIRPDG